jgi:transposase
MLTTLFSLPAHLLVEDVLIEDQVLTLLITSTLPEMPCPDCRQPSSRVHSRYTRTLADLPCQERAVRLLIQVRRFFCDGPACTRKTFAEAFDGVAPKYARRTSRQAESLRSIAYAAFRQSGSAPGEEALDANQPLHPHTPATASLSPALSDASGLGCR